MHKPPFPRGLPVGPAADKAALLPALRARP
jgi:hypothetical protein